eukprot:TRINITY_DN1200_c0_g2_i1.p1 TRINITY_DN1200_c0_g2~~TRINITY_DN1200_c0_g2_i1.p1  ORF type:complete len:461 (-),score=97.71 TRINITY_DN1200_c0_g2_i1:23-1405(-)
MAGLQGCFPISDLSTYTKGWTIRARVTARGPLRTFKSKNGGEDGKVFNVDVLDCEGGEIRCNFFHKAADLNYEKLQVGKCFKMSKGSLKIANRQYSALSHKYEIVFDKEAVIEEVADDTAIEQVKFHLVDFRSLASKTLPCTVDICGIIVSFKQPMSFTSRDGKELTKREVVLADDTAHSFQVTLWGERAQKEDKAFQENPVVCLKGVTVKEWNNSRFGSLREDGKLVFGDSMPEAKRVREWWSKGGSSQTLTVLSQEGAAGASRAPQGKPADFAQVRQVIDPGHVLKEQEVFTVTCRLVGVQTKKQGEDQPLYYMACQEPKEGNGLPCNRRVDQSNFCSSCNKAGKVAPRMNLRCKYADYGDSVWLTTFHEGAQRAVNLDATEAKEMESENREALESAVRRSYFQQVLQVTIRAKPEVYQNEARTNVSCIDARPVPMGEHGRLMLKEIQGMLEEEASKA